MTPGTFMSPDRTRNFLPLDPFRLFQTTPMRFLEDPFTVFRPFLPNEESMPFTAWTPLCDIFETDKELVLKMELPEMKKEDIHVEIDGRPEARDFTAVLSRHGVVTGALSRIEIWDALRWRDIDSEAERALTSARPGLDDIGI